MVISLVRVLVEDPVTLCAVALIIAFSTRPDGGLLAIVVTE